jgi:hypothetical protein
MGLLNQRGARAEASTVPTETTVPASTSAVGDEPAGEPRAGTDGPRAAGAAAETTSVRRVLETTALVVAPTTLATALLYYFGWTRTAAYASHFGITSSMFGYTPEDYLLRSIGALYYPALGALILALAAVYGHEFVRSRTDDERWRRPLEVVGRVIAVVGAAVLLSALVRILWPALLPSGRVVTPASLTIGFVLEGASAHLRRLMRGGHDDLRSSPAKQRTVVLKKAILALLVVLSLFWLVGDLALVEGRERAGETAATLSERPDAVVFAAQGLQLEAPGVIETPLEEPHSAYRFRYEGLKLLAHSNETFFLLPGTWTEEDGVAIVLHDTQDIRVEFAAPPE